MIKTFTATTRELDDVQAAVDEITSALELEKNLMKNSLGIISCFSEFGETGVLKAICDALPFDCIGTTTCLCAVGQEIDQMILAITVFTSDDCEFHTTVIAIDDNYEETVAFSVAELLEKTDEKPSVLLGYFPLLNTKGGDLMLMAIDRVTGGIPVFGTVTVDHNMDYSAAQTIYNGQMYRESVALGAIYGPVNVSFEIASLNEKKIRKQKAIITESNGNLLLGVNGKSVQKYLEEIGLKQAELGMGIVPFVIEHKDGTKPVARAVYTFTPEGYAACGGIMPEGASLAIGRVDADDVLQTAQDAAKPLVDDSGGVILCYSCLARYLALGLNVTTEAERIREAMAGADYHFAYSGGEICPLYDSEGKLKNYFHNYSIVFCKLS